MENYTKKLLSHLFSVSCQFVVISIFYQISMVFISYLQHVVTSNDSTVDRFTQDFREVLGVHD